jgi:predicted permease
MTIAQDCRYAVRTLLRAPGFTIAAVLSLAIGIGANTAIFSVASALLLRPLPYADADRLVILWNRSPGLGITEDWFSTAQYFDIRDGTSSFEQVAIAIGANYNLTGDGGEPERVGTIRVSSNLLPMLGARPVLGRSFASGDDREGSPGVAVLGFGTWQRRYGGDRSVVGRSIVLNGLPYQIVGMLERGFDLPREVMPTLGVVEHAEILINLPLAPNAANVRTREDYNILARLRASIPLQQAQAELDTLTAGLRRDYPDVYPPNGGLTFSAVPLQEQVVGKVRRSLVVLIAAVALVLVIACANVASLLVARAVARQQEIAVRASLGASRRRLAVQLLTESLLLALGGGAVGLLFAAVGLDGIRLLGAASVPRIGEIELNRTVLLFTLACSVASGLFFGIVPALRLGQTDLHAPLKDAGRRSSAGGALWGRGHNLRRLLVTSELALSIVVLIAAGLLIRSFAQLQTVAPGFNPENTLTLELTMSGRKYTDPQVVFETYRQLWERVARLPGVIAAAGVSALPLSQMMAWGPITVEGRTPVPGEAFINADQRMVGGDYFAAMRIPLVRGRLFDARDTRTSPRVILVDEHMANQLWPHDDAVGKRVRIGGSDAASPWLMVIGVVGRVKQDALDSEPRIAMYFPHAQFTARAMNLVVRSDGDPAALTSVIRAELQQLDPDLPMYGVRTMQERVASSLASRRFAMLLLALFAAVAMGLASIGIYSVLTYLVNQGTRELGIRMALGATPREVLLLIIKQGMSVTALGVTLGLAGAFITTRFMASLLFGVSAVDPVTFVTVPAILASAALLASYAPARRAARVDPMVSLRSE